MEEGRKNPNDFFVFVVHYNFYLKITVDLHAVVVREGQDAS